MNVKLKIGLSIVIIGLISTGIYFIIGQEKSIIVSASEHYYRAIGYEKQDIYDKAISEYEKALKIEENVGWYWCLGGCYYRTGKYDEAIEAYKKAIELDPTYKYSYRSLAEALQAKGLYDGAINMYERDIEIGTNSSWSYFSLGECFEKKGLFDKAIDYYTKYIQLEPGTNNADLAKERMEILRGK